MSCSNLDDTCAEFVDYSGDNLRIVTIGSRIAFETGESDEHPRFQYVSFTVEQAKEIAAALDAAIKDAGTPYV